jgi:hypothetical protein
MDSFIRSIMNAPRAKKRVITLCINSLFIAMAFWLALIVRLDSIVFITKFCAFLRKTKLDKSFHNFGMY